MIEKTFLNWINNIILTTFSSENHGKTALGEISWIGKTLLIKQCNITIIVLKSLSFGKWINCFIYMITFAIFSLILQDLGPLVGLKHEAEDDLEKIKLRIIKAPKVCILVFLHDISWCSWNQWQRNTVLVYKHHNIGFYSTQTRSPGPSADDRVASYYRLEADDAQVIW